MDHTAVIKKTLHTVRFVSMATVNADGSPHESPVVFLYDKNLDYMYWGSHTESQHSKNILRTGQVFFVAFNSVDGGTGVYMKATEGTIVEGEDLITALKVHNHFRSNIGKDEIELAYYQGKSPQKMWRAKVEKVWINAFERADTGRLVKDFKIEIARDLLTDLWE